MSRVLLLLIFLSICRATLTDCTTDGETEIPADCKCATDSTTNECEAGKFCLTADDGTKTCSITSESGKLALTYLENYSTEKGLEMLGSSFRWGEEYDLTVNILKDPDNMKDYAIGVGSTAVWGVLPALLLILICPCWCLGRCICACCKGKRRDEWNSKQRMVPLTCFCFILLIFISFGVLSMLANIQFRDAMWEKDKGSYYILKDDVVKGLENFLLNIYSDTTLIVDYAKDGGVIDTEVTKLKTDHSATIANGNTDIVNEVGPYCGTHDGAKYTNGVDHEIVQTKDLTGASKQTAYETEITTQGEVVWGAYDDTLKELETTMLDIRTDIFNDVNAANVDLLIPAINSTQDLYDDIKDMEESIEENEDYRFFGYIVFFVLPLVPILCCILPGTLMSSIMCITCAYSCAWFNATILFLLLGTHLPLSVFLLDTCQFLDQVEDDGFEWTLRQIDNGTGDMGELMDACLTDTSLVETFELEEQLNYTVAVNWPQFDDLDALFSFSQHWDPHRNVFLNGNYYDTGVFDPEAGCDVGSIDAATAGCSDALAAFNAVKDDASVDNIISSTKDSAILVDAAMRSLETTLQPVFDAGDNISGNLRCKFLGDAYWDFKEKMCTNVLKSLAWCLMCLAIGASFSLILCLISIDYRKQFLKSETEGEEDDSSYDEFNEKNGTTSKQGEGSEELELAYVPGQTEM